MRGFCQPGEKHDNFVKRLMDSCKSDVHKVKLSDDTIKKLLKITDCLDVDDALNVLMDRFRKREG